MRARLRSLYVGACEELASLLERRGDSTGVLGVLVKALEADPYPEDIQRRVMVLRADLGDWDGLDVQWVRLNFALENEQDLQPEEETREFYDSPLRALWSVPIWDPDGGVGYFRVAELAAKGTGRTSARSAPRRAVVLNPLAPCPHPT